MTFEEIEKSIKAHDRQLDVVVSTLASLAERLTQLVNLAEIQNARLTRLEDRL
jgi:hypothetical protein